MQLIARYVRPHCMQALPAAPLWAQAGRVVLSLASQNVGDEK